MEPKQYKPRALREKNVEDLTKSVASLRKELASLKVSKVASGVASKLAKIRVVRKAVARTLTTINQKNRQQLKDAFKNKASLAAFNTAHNTKFTLTRKPVELRARQTKALRNRLTKHQNNLRTQRAITKANNFPQRTFAVKA